MSDLMAHSFTHVISLLTIQHSLTNTLLSVNFCQRACTTSSFLYLFDFRPAILVKWFTVNYFLKREICWKLPGGVAGAIRYKCSLIKYLLYIALLCNNNNNQKHEVHNILPLVIISFIQSSSPFFYPQITTYIDISHLHYQQYTISFRM